jgi:hypothetical protein
MNKVTTKQMELLDRAFNLLIENSDLDTTEDAVAWDQRSIDWREDYMKFTESLTNGQVEEVEF